VDDLGTEPRWVDLRSYRHRTPTLEDPQYRSLVADIASAVSGVPKDEPIGEHIEQNRRLRRWRNAALAALTVLLVAVSATAVVAVLQRNQAQAEARTSTSQLLAAQAASIADTRPDLARQLLVEAYRLAPTHAATGAVLGSARIPRVRHVDQPGAADFSPRRQLLAITGESGLELVDPLTARQLSTDESVRPTAGPR